MRIVAKSACVLCLTVLVVVGARAGEPNASSREEIRGICRVENVRQSDKPGLITESLVALGSAAVPELCAMLAPVSGKAQLDEPVYSRVVEALGRIGDTSAGYTLFRELDRLAKEPEGNAWKIVMVCHAIRDCRVAEAQYLLENIVLWGGEQDSRVVEARVEDGEPVEAQSEPLMVALAAAGALARVGWPPKRQMAERFVMQTATARLATMSGEDAARVELLVALASVGSDESLNEYCKILDGQPYPSQEVFLALPRDSKHELLRKTLSAFVTEDPMARIGCGCVLLAALEVLSELPSSKETVPGFFWQKVWETHKVSLVSPSSFAPPPKTIRSDMLRPRLRAWMERVGIEEPALDALRSATVVSDSEPVIVWGR